MKAKILNLSNQYINLVKQNGIPVFKAFLFGSQVKGKTHSGSDIDICVVSPVLGNDVIDEMVKLGMIAHKIDDRIEPHPMSPKEFREKYNLLAHEVKTHGIPQSLDVN